MLKDMTLEEKIGQVMMVGFTGTEASDQIKSMIKDYKVGSVITFPRNVRTTKQVKEMLSALQDWAKANHHVYPLILATDQENGRVAHRIGEDAPRFPGSMNIGATFSHDDARLVAKGLAIEMRKLGYNTVLSPSLDINCNPDNPVIGVRSFGETAEHVAGMGGAYISGLHEGGIGAVAKHFPGHGDTETDSHLALPTVPHPLEKLKQFELIPFQEAINHDVDMIMTSHIYFSAIEEKGVPATLSSRLLQNVLRTDMGYNGVIISDCLEMNAISKTIGSAEGAVKAFLAGVDILIISHTYDTQVRVFRRLYEAVQSGEIPEQRLDESVERVIRFKQKMADLQQSADERRDLNSVEKEEEAHRNVARQVTGHGITLLKDEDHQIPLSLRQNDKLFVVNAATNWQSDAGFEERGARIFPEEMKRYHREVEEWWASPQYIRGGLDSTRLPDADQVVVMTFNAYRYADQAQLVNKVIDKYSKVIVIAFGNPYDLSVFPEAKTFLNTYEPSRLAAQVAADILFGRRKARGRLPVHIPRLCEIEKSTGEGGE